MPLTLLILGVLVVVPLAVLFIGRRHVHPLVAVIAALLYLGVAWVLAVLAVATDYRDADGFIDCWPYCSMLQDAVGKVLWVAPFAGLVVILAAVADFVVRRHKRNKILD